MVAVKRKNLNESRPMKICLQNPVKTVWADTEASQRLEILDEDTTGILKVKVKVSHSLVAQGAMGC